MGLRLYRRAEEFSAALTACSGAVYAICNRDLLDPAEVQRLERAAMERGHKDLLRLSELRPGALQEIEAFFREAAQLDPDWCYAYSSKVILSIPDYQDLQQVFLLRRLFSSQGSGAVLALVPDLRLHRLFEELFNGVCPRGRTALPGFRAWARCMRTLLRSLANRGRTAPARVLLFTLSAGVPARGRDAYFGDLERYLPPHGPAVTVYLSSGSAIRLPRHDQRLPFEAFVSISDVVLSWVHALVSGLRTYRTLADSSTYNNLEPLHRYLRIGEIKSGEHFMHGLFRRVFPRMLQTISPRVLLYPFENRSWEKMLLSAARSQGVSRRIAYQHSSITRRHLAFQVDNGELPEENLPDRIIAAGEHTARWLRSTAPALGDRLEIGVSLRTTRHAVADSKTPGVLVAISSSRSEAWNLLLATHAAAAETTVPFIVRTHPTIPVDGMFRHFEWPSNVELSSGRTLAEDLSRVTMVVYSSSTVALEGMLYGRIPIFLDTGDVPSGDPIIGEYPFKFQATHVAPLVDCIKMVAGLGGAKLAVLQEQARDFAERYLISPTPEAISRMVDRITRD
ncbi:MAG: hypothetical protein FJY54_12695 [Betaproteobacteria bacterium]|nr:hypothetical protein [Betaproteobacteria bacterium]